MRKCLGLVLICVEQACGLAQQITHKGEALSQVRVGLGLRNTSELSDRRVDEPQS